MPTKIKMELEFNTTSSENRSFSDSVSHDGESSDEGKKNLAREMFAELQKAVSFTGNGALLPDLGDDLLQTGQSRRVDPMAFIDIFNVPALWLEINNTFLGLRYMLSQAKAYKDLEPPNTSPLNDQLCVYLHFEKMYRFDLAVFELIKIQDLVVRLLQESFSGRLISVDYDEDGWERDLTLSDAKKGLNAMVKSGDLTDQDRQAILDALAKPSNSPYRKTVVTYRNALAHGIRPSVDYPELYTVTENRAGQVIKDASGKEIGRSYAIRAGKSKPDFLFNDLFTAISAYMGDQADMLRALKRIPRLS